MTKLALTALISATLCMPVLQAGAAGADPAVLEAARAQQPAVIQALDHMVHIESGSDDARGLEKMSAYVQGRLRALGAKVDVVAATPGKAPGLVRGSFAGDGKLRIALIAHMDTVYHRGILETEPFRRDGNRLYGPGIADAKGGIAVILHALEVLQQLGWKDYARLTVLFNADEEIGSPGSGSIIETLGAANDVVLSYEPSPSAAVAGGTTGVLLQTAGTATATLHVHGRAAHAGAAADEGRNALIELASQILNTRDTAKTVPDMQMNWTMATAGTARNQIPASAEAIADVRISDPHGPEKLLAALQAKVAKPSLVADTTTTVTLEVARPMFIAGPRGTALAKLAQRVYAELDMGGLSEQHSRDMPGGEFAFSGRNLMLIPGTTGGTDAGFAANSGKPAVLESLGLAGWGFHAKNEYIEIDSIVPRLYLSSRMLMELGKQANAGTLP